MTDCTVVTVFSITGPSLIVCELLWCYWLTLLTFHRGRFWPRGQQRSRSSCTRPSTLQQLSLCSWEKNNNVRREDKNLVRIRQWKFVKNY